MTKKIKTANEVEFHHIRKIIHNYILSAKELEKQDASDPQVQMYKYLHAEALIMLWKELWENLMANSEVCHEKTS